MDVSPRWLLAAGLFLASLIAVPAQGPESLPSRQANADEQLLRSLGVATDGPGLLHALRKRTPSAYRVEIVDGVRTIEARGADHERLRTLVNKLGELTFASRESAARELVLIGLPAVGVLRQATEDADPEVRAAAQRCMRAIELSPGSTLPAAIVRLLRQRQPEGTGAAMLNYAALVPDETVEEELLLTLRHGAVRGGRTDLVLLAALTSADAEKRAAAAFVIGQVGNADERPHVRRLLTDSDARVRLRAAQGLIAGRELGAVPALVNLLGDAPLDVARAAEDVLCRLAGERAPRVDPDAGRRRWQDAWVIWWRSNQDRLELTRGPDLIVLNPNRRAREAAERFMHAYARFDLDGMKGMTELPFHELGENRVARTGERLDVLFREALNFRGDGVLTWSLGTPHSFADYARQLNPGQRTLLARYRRPDVRVMAFDVRSEDSDGDPFGMAGLFFIRVGNAGQSRVIAIASEDTLPRPSR